MAAALGSLAGEPGPDVLRQVIAVFVGDTAGRLQAMREAAATGDAEKLYREAHTVKGSSANLGATGMAELARAVETLGRGGHVEGADEMLEALEREFGRVRGQCEAIMAEATPS